MTRVSVPAPTAVSQITHAQRSRHHGAASVAWAACAGVACTLASIAAGAEGGVGLESTRAALQDERYIRVSDLPEGAGVALEISTRTLRHPDGGPDVHLVGVAHIAEGLFFEQRQDQLDGYDLVLYEGVGPTWYKLGPDATPEARARVSVERIRYVGTVAEMAKAEDGAYPASPAQLLESTNGYDRRLLAVAMLDGWLRPVRYEVAADGQSVRVSSLGADGREGGEGIDADLKLGDQPAISPEEVGNIRGVQEMMASATGLEFQLEAMDYVRSNWKNSDMTIDEFVAAMSETDGAGMFDMGAMGAGDGPGGADAGEFDWRSLLPEGVDPDAVGRMLGLKDADADTADAQGADTEDIIVERVGDEPADETIARADEGADDMAALNNQFMDLMSGQGNLMEMIEPVLQMIGNNPMMRSSTRLMMIEMLGRADELMGGGGMGGANPMAGMMDVLLVQRNLVAIDELKSTLANRGDEVGSVALFYGAAHLEGMERTLVEDMGYEVVATTWAPAISVRYADMGMPPAQGRMIHGMMTQMIEEMLGQMGQMDQANQP